MPASLRRRPGCQARTDTDTARHGKSPRYSPLTSGRDPTVGGASTHQRNIFFLGENPQPSAVQTLLTRTFKPGWSNRRIKEKKNGSKSDQVKVTSARNTDCTSQWMTEVWRNSVRQSVDVPVDRRNAKAETARPNAQHPSANYWHFDRLISSCGGRAGDAFPHTARDSYTLERIKRFPSLQNIIVVTEFRRLELPWHAMTLRPDTNRRVWLAKGRLEHMYGVKVATARLYRKFRKVCPRSPRQPEDSRRIPADVTCLPGDLPTRAWCDVTPRENKTGSPIKCGLRSGRFQNRSAASHKPASLQESWSARTRAQLTSTSENSQAFVLNAFDFKNMKVLQRSVVAVAVFLTCLVHALPEGKGECDGKCACPAQPVTCLPGVRLLEDRCGCRCKVCASLLGEECSEMAPCDDTVGLYCDYSRDKPTGVCKATFQAPCVFQGKVYQSGEAFELSCREKCVCQNGAVGCTPLCPQEVRMPSDDCPFPRLEKVPGKCCKQWMCDAKPKELSAKGPMPMIAGKLDSKPEREQDTRQEKSPYYQMDSYLGLIPSHGACTGTASDSDQVASAFVESLAGGRESCVDMSDSRQDSTRSVYIELTGLVRAICHFRNFSSSYIPGCLYVVALGSIFSHSQCQNYSAWGKSKFLDTQRLSRTVPDPDPNHSDKELKQGSADRERLCNTGEVKPFLAAPRSKFARAGHHSAAREFNRLHQYNTKREVYRRIPHSVSGITGTERPTPGLIPPHFGDTSAEYPEPVACLLQATSWSQCSVTCGMGVSTRVSNHNPECRMQVEKRICQMRPCDLQYLDYVKDGKKCRSTIRSMEPSKITFSWYNTRCTTVKAYKWRWCGGCTISGRCCTPYKVKTTTMDFICEDRTPIKQDVAWIHSCTCHRNCPQQ
ncbi:hypothetical protein Bbelb_090810 [Branchiostoma belcheri]|nr:hypothetical protein Bbelb_090810 [Branchiostoma belcheri]